MSKIKEPTLTELLTAKLPNGEKFNFFDSPNDEQWLLIQRKLDEEAKAREAKERQQIRDFILMCIHLGSISVCFLILCLSISFWTYTRTSILMYEYNNNSSQQH